MGLVKVDLWCDMVDIVKDGLWCDTMDFVMDVLRCGGGDGFVLVHAWILGASSQAMQPDWLTAQPQGLYGSRLNKLISFL